MDTIVSVDDVACLEHSKELCACDPSLKCLRYRYTMEEMPDMIRQLKRRAESYDSWCQRAKSALSATGSDRLCEYLVNFIRCCLMWFVCVTLLCV